MFTQKLVTVYGQYVVSEYHGDYTDGCEVFRLNDKDAVDKFRQHMQSVFKFKRAQDRLKKGVLAGRAKRVKTYSLDGFYLKIGGRKFKQTACYSEETYKR